MVWWDIVEGRLPFWKTQCNNMLPASIEKDLPGLLNAKYRSPCRGDNTIFLPNPAAPEYQDELRTTSTVVGPGTFVIFRNAASLRNVLEISLQPNADCNLQLFDGQEPMSSLRFVQANLLWSAPGKIITGDLILTVTAGVTVQVEVRSKTVL
jgi:hypothetical protein